VIVTGPSAAATFCGAARDATAAWRARCFGGAAADWRATLDDVASCAELDALVAGGTARFHAELAAACLEASRADRDCAEAEPTCFTHVIEGLVATDALCKSDFECAYNAGCWAGPIELAYNACRASRCVHIPDRVGDACAEASDFHCFTGLRCVAGVCQREGAEGEDCATTRPHTSPSGAGCGFGLSCWDGQCRRRSDGGACGSDGDCVPTQYCAPPGECRPRTRLGEGCDPTWPSCAAFATCGPDAVCVPAGHLGEPCGRQVDFPNLCAEGVCSPDGCARPLPDGSDCLFARQCASRGCDGARCASCAP
jgi:hypothetical protein